MNKRIIYVLVSALVIVAITSIVLLKLQQSSAQDANPGFTADDTGADAAAVNEAVRANNQFALDLYSELTAAESSNLFFSPLSISVALAMTYEGARGQTANEMQSVFYFLTDEAKRRSSYAAIYNRLNRPDSKYQLSVANSLWAQQGYPFLAEYLDVVKRYYAGEAQNVDFMGANEETRQKINNWVAERTADKIKDLFPVGSLDEFTRLVLVNAIYFKGTWINQFDKDQTKDEDFHVGATETVKAPMMRLIGGEAKFNYTEAAGAQVLEMPYEGDRLSMLVLLPKNGDLSDLEDSLTWKKLSELRSGLEERPVDVFLPKFKLDTKYFMNGTLAKMGMPTAFNPSVADFSGMDGTRNLFIGLVVHQAFVDVDEEGTEAAAATGVVMDLSSASRIPVFRADHPFIFLIQDRDTGNILFMGRVTNPIAASP